MADIITKVTEVTLKSLLLEGGENLNIAVPREVIRVDPADNFLAGRSGYSTGDKIITRLYNGKPIPGVLGLNFESEIMAKNMTATRSIKENIDRYTGQNMPFFEFNIPNNGFSQFDPYQGQVPPLFEAMGTVYVPIRHEGPLNSLQEVQKRSCVPGTAVGTKAEISDLVNGINQFAKRQRENRPEETAGVGGVQEVLEIPLVRMDELELTRDKIYYK